MCEEDGCWHQEGGLVDLNKCWCIDTNKGGFGD